MLGASAWGSEGFSAICSPGRKHGWGLDEVTPWNGEDREKKTMAPAVRVYVAGVTRLPSGSRYTAGETNWPADL